LIRIDQAKNPSHRRDKPTRRSQHFQKTGSGTSISSTKGAIEPVDIHTAMAIAAIAAGVTSGPRSSFNGHHHHSHNHHNAHTPLTAQQTQVPLVFLLFLTLVVVVLRVVAVMNV